MIASISFGESMTFGRHNGWMARKASLDLDRAARIKHVRTKLLGLRSQEKFAEVLSEASGYPLTRGAVGNWEQGKDIGLDNLKAISEFADISLDWLASGSGEEPSQIGQQSPNQNVSRERVPLLGYVRAGATAHYYATATDPLDWVQPVDGGSRDTAALQIQGESLGSFFDQWLVYYDEVRSPVTNDMIGKLCVVGLMDDRVVIKKIRRSKTSGLFDLESNEGREDIPAVQIIWAARVKHMVPR